MSGGESQIHVVKQFRFEFKREQRDAGLSYFITMVHCRRVIDTGEWLIAKVGEACRFTVLPFQHERDKPGLMGVAGKRARLLVDQAVYHHGIHGPSFSDVAEELAHVERSGQTHLLERKTFNPLPSNALF
jgi:hypothetical protein